MKILQVIPSLQMGGAEKFAIDLSNQFARNNHTVFLCVLDEIINQDIKKMVDTNVILISLNKKQSYSFKTILDIYKLINAIRPDIIHTHLRALVYTALSLVRFRIPCLHTVHNLAEKEIGSKYRILYKLLYKISLVTPVSITEEVLKSVQKVYGKEHSNLIYNGVPQLSTTDLIEEVKREVFSYKMNKETKVILNIGRVSKQKNQLMLVQAVNELIQEGENIVLIIIGSLTNEADYAQLCQKKAQKNIYFLGEKYNISDYMYYCDAFILSSIYEGLPLVVLEAMSMNKIIISTPAGGVPDIIKSLTNGIIAQDFSKNSLKNAIKKYLDQDEYIVNNLTVYNEKYSMEICQKNYLKLYQNLSI